MNRIAIVGATGSGKSTLAGEVSAILNIPLVDLDALHWLPNWAMTPDDEFQAKLQAALSGERWVTAGNYGKVRPLIWGRAELLVWLDYPLPLVFLRLFKRTVRRVVTGERVCGDNRESFRTQFLSRDSLFFWLLQTHPQHRCEYPHLLEQPEYQHLQLLRLTRPRQTDDWFRQLAPG